MLSSTTNTNNFVYDKTQANVIAGIALLMMFVHHFFGFPEWLKNDNLYISLFTIKGIAIERISAAFCKLCVGIFAFNSGYTMSENTKAYDLISKRIRRLFQFLFSYWCICALFIVYALIFKEKLPTLNLFILNAFGLYVGPGETVNVVYAWYVSFYISIVLLFPYLCKLFKEKSPFMNIARMFILIIISSLYFNKLPPFVFSEVIHSLITYSGCWMMGFLFSKHQLFNFFNKYIKSSFTLTVSLILVFTIRQGLALSKWEWCFIMESLYVPVFIFATCALIERVSYINFKSFFLLISKYSMNLWFLHSIFATADCKIQWLLYWPKYSILIFIWGVALLLPIAYGISILQNLLWNYSIKTFKAITTR